MNYVYITTNTSRKVLYTGVTSDISSRIIQHKNKSFGGFTSKYNADVLVFFEAYTSIEDAISREKQIKSWSRRKKLALIESVNPEWRELDIILSPGLCR